MTESSRRSGWLAGAAVLLLASASVLVASLRGRTAHEPIEPAVAAPAAELARSASIEAELEGFAREEPRSKESAATADAPTPPEATDRAERRRLQWEAWYASTSLEAVHERIRFLDEYVSRTKAIAFSARFDRGQVEDLGPGSTFGSDAWDELELREVRIPGLGGGSIQQVRLSRAEYPALYERYDELRWLSARISYGAPPPASTGFPGNR